MLGTLVRRVTIKTLDVVVEQGEQSPRSGVRVAARALNRARGVLGLRKITRKPEIPAWQNRVPDQHMWKSDELRLEKHRVESGIISGEEDTAAADKDVHAIKVYFKRGCPYTRAALDLLRERDIEFEEQDVTMDETTRGWLKIVTGKATTPQIFIHGEPIGGYDELRTLDLDGTLKDRIAGVAVLADASPAEEAEPEIAEMTVAELKERVADGAQVLLLDVRTEAEVSSGVLSHAVHIPVEEITARCDELDPEGVWIVYCRSGKRSVTAAQRMATKGFRSVVSLAGGIEAWRAAGGETVGFGDTQPRKTPARRRLPVLHPKQSPFEGLADEASVSQDEPRLDRDDLIARVREVLDECRPMVQADGGDIELLDVIGDVVHVQLTGNCIGCPSSQATLKQGIERRLKTRIPQVTGIASPQL
ncbi:MAG: NifU family protein [Nannocystaceae bacterium]|nr:NifU family protein [Nannocystaceae bacterium]